MHASGADDLSRCVHMAPFACPCALRLSAASVLGLFCSSSNLLVHPPHVKGA